MSPSTNTLSISTKNINISTEAITIPTLTSPFMTKYVVYTTVQAMFDLSKEYFNKIKNKFDKNDATFNSKHEELVIIKTDTLCLSKDTKAQKKLPSFHQNSLKKMIIFLHLTHPLKNALRT